MKWISRITFALTIWLAAAVSAEVEIPVHLQNEFAKYEIPEIQTVQNLNQAGTVLRVMTYNVNGLPWPLKSNKAPLFKEMARIIQEQRALNQHPQILVVQEGFRKNVSHFIENTGYKYIIKGPNSKVRKGPEEKSDAIINSGLYILSDFPILKTDFVVFGRDCAGWDCLANKAVLYAQVDIPEIGLVDLFNTHLNSNGSSGKSPEKVAQAQLKQLTTTQAFVQANTSVERLAIFSGDFNIRSSNEMMYNHFLNFLLPFYSVGEFCKHYRANCEMGRDTELMEILDTPDQQFYKSSLTQTIYPIFATKSMREMLGDRKLSDHFAYDAHFMIKKNN